MDSTRDDDDEQVNLLVVDYQETILLAAVHCHATFTARHTELVILAACAVGLRPVPYQGILGTGSRSQSPCGN